MLYVYDIEIYCNFFSATFKKVNEDETFVFVVHKNRNDIDALHTFISDSKKWLVGYNSFNFDNQLLNYIYKFHFKLSMSSSDEITDSIYQLARIIVDSDFGQYKYNLPFNFIDLMKVGFYRKSLKLLGVSLKWHKLQDLPIEWTHSIKEDQVDLILKYNMNDVLITERLFHHLEDNIKLRFDISKRYNVNVYSESDSGIANRLLEKFYSETSGLPIQRFKNLRTPRPFIKFDWVVFDDIYFRTSKFDTLLEEIKNYTYYKDRNPLKRVISFDGIRYKMGFGGLHSMDTGAMFEADDDNYLIDADMNDLVSG